MISQQLNVHGRAGLAPAASSRQFHNAGDSGRISASLLASSVQPSLALVDSFVGVQGRSGTATFATLCERNVPAVGQGSPGDLVDGDLAAPGQQASHHSVGLPGPPDLDSFS